jgi:hypothetical protein
MHYSSFAELMPSSRNELFGPLAKNIGRAGGASSKIVDLSLSPATKFR